MTPTTTTAVMTNMHIQNMVASMDRPSTSASTVAVTQPSPIDPLTVSFVQGVVSGAGVMLVILLLVMTKWG